jgi:pimeloyl-ACP methyl ester carboxylesterase
MCQSRGVTKDYALELDTGTIRVRESGDPAGIPVVHFHGTPGSRVEMAWADNMLEQQGYRWIAFDRPGYGKSTQAPYSLTRVAAMALEVADAAGVAELFTTGWSGGGPFALATASGAPQRVLGVGVMSGAGPFRHVTGAFDRLSPNDAEAVPYLASDPQRAAELLSRDFNELSEIHDVDGLRAGFDALLSARDKRVLADQRIAESLLADIEEAARQGPWGGAWDNVAYIGEWDFDLASVGCPVRLWYGDEDLMAAPPHGQWLADHLPDATLTVRQGYGHLSPFEHLDEMLQELTAGGKAPQ